MISRPIPHDDRRDERPVDLDLGPRESRQSRAARKARIEALLIPDERGRLITAALISIIRERVAEAKAEAKAESSQIVA